MIVGFNTNKQFFVKSLPESLVALRPAHLSIRKYAESSIAASKNFWNMENMRNEEVWC